MFGCLFKLFKIAGHYVEYPGIPRFFTLLSIYLVIINIHTDYKDIDLHIFIDYFSFQLEVERQNLYPI